MTQSTFISKEHQSHHEVADGTLNSVDGIEPMLFGSGTGKTPVASNPRDCAMHCWHLGDPGTGDVIPKTAVIDRVSVQLIPTLGFSYTGNGATMRMALMAADGHWDRSRSQTLHQQQQIIDGPPSALEYLTTYSAPAVNWAVELYARNASVQIAETITSGGTADLTALAAPMHQSFGCTIEIPAGETLDEVRIPLGRADVPFGDLGLAAQLYSLDRNSREGVVAEKVQLSSPVGYLSLPVGTTSMQTFTFSPAIAAEDSDRWVGVIIEGPLFNPLFAALATFRLIFRSKSIAVQTTYPAGTLGSMLYASTEMTVHWENSFPGYYYDGRSTPVLYQNASQSELTTPYDRAFGNTLEWAGVEPFAGAIDVVSSYGSDVGDEPMSGDIVAEVQAWIDSANYNPSTGRYWLGMFMDQEGPQASQYVAFHGPDGDNTAIKLVLDWHPQPGEITVESFDVDAAVTVEAQEVLPLVSVQSADIAPTLTAESTDVAPSVSIESEDIAPTLTAESADVTPSVSIEGEDIAPTLTAESAGVAPNMSIESSSVSPALTIESKGVQNLLTVESKTVDPIITAIPQRGVKP